jgi:serine/threonine-protein kinase
LVCAGILAIAAVFVLFVTGGDRPVGPGAVTAAPATSAGGARAGAGAAPSNRPSSRPPSHPSSPPGSTPKAATASDAPNFDAALVSVRRIIDEGSAAGQLRRDVAVDLQQLLDNTDAAAVADRPRMVSNLRVKVAARTNEGAISPAIATRLDAALGDLSSAATAELSMAAATSG